MSTSRHDIPLNEAPAAGGDEDDLSLAPWVLDIRQRLSARLRGHRIHRNMTGTALARAAGISGAMLSKIESGERIPSVPVLVALSRALGIDVGELFGNTSASSAPVLITARDREAHDIQPDDNHIRIEQLGLMELPEIQIRLLRMTGNSRSRPTKPVIFDGFWIDHVLRGEIVMRIGSTEYHLRAGDTLTYRGDVPHHLVGFPGGETELLVVQGWMNSSVTNQIKLDGALIAPGTR